MTEATKKPAAKRAPRAAAKKAEPAVASQPAAEQSETLARPLGVPAGETKAEIKKDPARCSAEKQSGMGASYQCERSLGHAGEHETHFANGNEVSWTTK